MCFTWRTYAEFESALNGAGLKVANCIVWDKRSIGLGNAHYRPQHEFMFYCKGDDWRGGKAESDIWSLSGATSEYVHPTQKPVELLERALNNSSKAGDVVIDSFGGSGSTLIACEKTGRAARLMDLDQKYCDRSSSAGKTSRAKPRNLSMNELTAEQKTLLKLRDDPGLFVRTIIGVTPSAGSRRR